MDTTPMESLELARLCHEAVMEKKAEEVVLLDMRGVSSFCDFFLICTGTADPHLKAIASNVEMKVKEHGRMPRGRDGVYASHWVIVDYGDVVVHVFRADVRHHYALERLWGDAKRV